MKQVFFRFIRFAALTTLLCVCAMPEFALAASENWQALVNEYATLKEQGQYERAFEVGQKALALAESEPDKDHMNVALSLSMLGSTYTNRAQYVKALPVFQRLLTLKETILGPDHLDTASSLSNLASTYGRLAQHDKALPLQQSA